MKVLTIMGTRPEGIKLAPVLRALARQEEHGIQSLLCVTGQHRQMLDQVIRLFELTPDYDLNVMVADQSPTEVVATALTRLDPLLRRERPDWVLVQGDTSTVAAGALAAFYAGARVAHVEAGLRTHDRYHPFPEEINRKVVSAIAELHFAPTPGARQNLLDEGIAEAAIAVTGNPVIDAIQWAAALPEPREVRELLVALGINKSDRGSDVTTGRDPVPPRLIVVTAHRRENLGAPLEQICLALRDLAERYAGQVRIVYPVHLNPNVQQPVRRILEHTPNVTLIAPLDYLHLVHLLKRAYLTLTDSGGIQEEAPSLGTPVLVLREVTERPEAVAAGTVRIIGTARARIVEETVRLLEDAEAYAAMAHAVSPYGDGHAGERIVQRLLEWERSGSSGAEGPGSR